jgi:hypothetical protein
MGAKGSKTVAAAPPAKGGKKAGASKQSSSVTAADRAVLGLKVQRDSLNRAERRAEALAGRLRAGAATALAAGNRRRALDMLRQRKSHEAQLVHIRAHQLNVEQMLLSVEGAQLDRQVAAAMTSGTDALNALVKSMGDVEGVMDRLHDAIADANDVSELVTEPLQEDCEEEALAELAALVGQTAPATAVGASEELPTVPSHALPDVVREPAAAVGEAEEEEAPRARVAA